VHDQPHNNNRNWQQKRRAIRAFAYFKFDVEVDLLDTLLKATVLVIREPLEMQYKHGRQLFQQHALSGIHLQHHHYHHVHCSTLATQHRKQMHFDAVGWEAGRASGL